MPAPADRRLSPMWIAHHWPEDYDRCVRLGHHHVCRRCLVLYPLALATATVVLLAGPEAIPGGGTTTMLVTILGPLAAVVDFIGEHLGWWGPSPRRLVAVTIPLGIGFGVGLARYLEHLSDPVFWGVVVVYGGACLAAGLSGRRR